MADHELGAARFAILAVRARMARTGESYQKALSSLHHVEAPTQSSTCSEATDSGVDLLPIRYFGAPATVATFEIAGRLAVLVVSSSHRAAPFPQNPIVALGPPRTVH
ncbi:MAG: hypothetical protein IPF92_19285 [Myxococcales bacterium]|nr:hypothetical protein [Myxococcales bacterium]